MKKLSFQAILILVFAVFFSLEAAAQETWYYMLRWSADGELLAVATSSGVEIYDETLSLVQTINPGSNRVTSIDWHPEGTQLAVTHGGVEIWTRGADNLLTFSERLEISGATLGVFWNADGSRLAAFNGADTRESPESERLFPGHRATVVIWNTETWQVVVETTEQYLIPDFQGIYEFDWHPNDPHIFVVAGAQTYIDSAGNRATTPLSAFIINSEMGNVEYMINDIVKIDVYGVTWHPDGNHFSLSGQSSVGTFTVPSGELIDGYFVAEARNLQWRSDGAYLLADSGLFAAGNPDILVWIPDTVPDTVTTWHPINDTITVIIDGVPTAYDLTTIPGYIPLALPPIADAGSDQTVTAANDISTQVTLDGSGSTGDIVSYVWTIDDVEIATGVNPTVALDVGVHIITLTVTDDNDATDSDDVTITVVAGESPTATPTATNTPSNTPTPTPEPAACDITVTASDSSELVSAINTANGDGTLNVICLTQSIYAFTTQDNHNNGPNALPVITSDITILGNGASLFRDTGAPNFRFFNVASNGNLTLEQITLSGGHDPGNDGGAVWNQGPVTIIDSTLSNNHARHGSAVHSNGPLTIINSTFSSNNAADNGAVYFNFWSGTLNIAGSTFNDNSARHGAGVYLNVGEATISNSSFIDNAAVDHGGGVHINFSQGTLNVSDTTFTGNSAQHGGGLYLNAGAANLTNVDFVGNIASDHGGGLRVNYFVGPVVIDVGLFDNNTAAHGGGIYSQGDLTVTDSIFTANSASQMGGGISQYHDIANRVENSCFSGNSAVDGGGIYVDVPGLDASDNWWGAADGPSGAGSGSGDAVVASLVYNPFLTNGCPHDD